jgi:hypothetical protein
MSPRVDDAVERVKRGGARHPRRQRGANAEQFALAHGAVVLVAEQGGQRQYFFVSGDNVAVNGSGDTLPRNVVNQPSMNVT